MRTFARDMRLRRISQPQGTGAAPETGPQRFVLARQPIFDRSEELVGHRLICEAFSSGAPGGYLASMPQGPDSELLLAEELHRLVPRGRVFLSISRDELLELRALCLPTDRFVLCLRAAEPLDDDLRDALDRHSMRGFQLALDGVDRAIAARSLFGRAATAIIDVRGWAVEPLAEFVVAVRTRLGPQELMANGVHSRSSLESCKQMGFDLFEGQFFLKPKGPAKRSAAEVGLGGLGAMAELAATDNFERLAEIITRDPGLSLRLLRYANSAHVALPRPVGSVHEALAWLGTVTVRQFSLIAAVANVDAAPAEMLVTALTRARMCQQLARQIPGCDPEESFTVGLFSVAEAVANAPIGKVVGELPLREDIASALIVGDGELGALLHAVIEWEHGEFASARSLTGGGTHATDAYLEALRWADSAVTAMG